MDLKEYLKIFHRRRLAMLVSFLLIVGIYGVLLFRIPKTYTSRGSLLLQMPPFEEQIFSKVFQNAYIAAKAIDMQTQLRLMSSHPAMEKVAQRVKRKGIRISAKEAQQLLKFGRDERSPVILITATSTDPRLSQAVVQAALEVAVEENERFAKESYARAIAFLDKQFQRYASELQETQDQIVLFNQKHGVLSFSDEVQQRLQHLSDLSAKLQDTDLSIAELSAQLDQVEAKLRQEPAYAKVLKRVPNPELAFFRQKLLDLEFQRESLSSLYTEEHPKMQALLKRERDLKKTMATKMAKFLQVPEEVVSPDFVSLRRRFLDNTFSLEGLKVRREVLSTILDKEKSQVLSLSKDQQAFAALLEKKGTAERVRDRLRDLRDELEVNRVTRGNAKLLDPASQAFRNARTSISLVLVVLGVSLFFTLSLGVLLEFLDDTVRHPFTITRFLKLEFLGSVPFLKNSTDRLLIHLFPKSPVADPYHRAAFNLHQSALKAKAEVISVTSAKPKEGKTTAVINTGIALAWAGEEVLLMDADFRHPSLHRPFDISNALGLSSLLSGELEAEQTLEALQGGKEAKEPSLDAQIESLIRPTSIAGLSLLPAGPPAPNPIHLLQGKLFREVLALLKARNLLILIDTPPLFVVTDSMVVANRVDGTLLVVAAKTTKKQEALYAKKQLLAANTPILGVLLTMRDITEEISFYYSYRGKADYAY